MAKPKKTTADDDPDKLTRESAGRYRTGDKRFEIRQTGVGWYLVDLEHTDELGQELLHGPYATLNDAREGIQGARTVVPMSRPKPRARAEDVEKKPPAPPKTWIDRLPPAEEREVRQLITALDRAGVEDAEKLVKRSRSSSEPVIAAALVEHELKQLVEAAEPEDRRSYRELTRRVLAVLVDQGEFTRQPLPGWELVERSSDGGTPRRLRPTV